MAGDFDHRHVQPVAMQPRRLFSRANLTAAILPSVPQAKAGVDQHVDAAREVRSISSSVIVSRIDPLDVDLDVVRETGVNQRLGDAHIGVA